jgi:hypothetical protein
MFTGGQFIIKIRYLNLHMVIHIKVLTLNFTYDYLYVIMDT